MTYKNSGFLTRRLLFVSSSGSRLMYNHFHFDQSIRFEQCVDADQRRGRLKGRLEHFIACGARYHQTIRRPTM
jgi:hypothetical protein